VPTFAGCWYGVEILKYLHKTKMTVNLITSSVKLQYNKADMMYSDTTLERNVIYETKALLMLLVYINSQ